MHGTYLVIHTHSGTQTRLLLAVLVQSVPLAIGTCDDAVHVSSYYYYYYYYFAFQRTTTCLSPHPIVIVTRQPKINVPASLRLRVRVSV